MLRPAVLSRFNAEAPEGLEDGLLPHAELAHKLDDGDRFFGQDLRFWGLIVIKPPQDAGEYQTELIRLEHAQFSYRSHVRIR